MIVTSLDDMRDVLKDMLKRRRTTIHALESIAAIGKGSLQRFLRGTVFARRANSTGKIPVITDLRFTTVLRLVEASDYELIIQPKQQKNRRERVLDEARRRGGGGDSDDVQRAPEAAVPADPVDPGAGAS